MRIANWKLRGFPTFPEEVSIDLDALGDALLVAFTGANGAGKSTALELALALVDRQCPTRGDLNRLARDRDAFVEGTVVNGARYTIRHLIDAVGKRGEALVLDEAGEPVLDTTKVREFDAWSEKHFDARGFRLASMFTSQDSRGMLGMTAGERKAVVLRALGIEYYEQLAELARQHAAAARSRVAAAERALEEVRAGGADADGATAVLDAAREAVVVAEANLATAREALAASEEAARAAADLRRVAGERASQRAAALERVTSAEKVVRDLDERIRNNQSLIDRADEIRRAAARDAEIAGELATLGARRAGVAAASDAALREMNAALKSAGNEQRSIEFNERRKGEAGRKLAAAEGEVAAAAAALPEAREELRQAEERLASITAELDEARARLTAAAVDRVIPLRDALVAIRDTDHRLDHAKERARMAVEGDEARVRDASELPGVVRGLESEQRTYAGYAKTRASWVEVNERCAAQDLDSLRDAVTQAQSDLDAARARLAEAEAASAAASEHLGAANAEAEDIDARLDRLVAEHNALAKTVKLVDALARAEARLAELQPQLERAGADLDAAKGALDALPPLATPAAVDTAPLVAAVHAAEKAYTTAVSAVAVAERQLEATHAAAARAEQLAAELAAAQADLANYNHLADAFGRDGLQALEIDAAGPMITALANDLLHDSFGPRFSVRLDTTRLDSKAHREIETFKITVIDSEKGHEGDGSEFSGGERVIINEALALALTMVACNRSGVKGVTLFRDESGAALDPSMARGYVRMLRRAAMAVGASRCVFVSHNPAVWALADARLHVEDGRIERRDVQEAA